MSVEELINRIKGRLGMYIGEPNFDYLYYYISGFLYNNSATNRVSDIEKSFSYEFHKWVQKWIRENKGVHIEEEIDYHSYIKIICKSDEECINLFFELCSIFFKEFHNKN